MIKKAFMSIFPEKNTENYNFEIRYTDKFRPYNANVKYFKNNIQFNLSKKWKNISEEIRIGLVQELLLKIFKEKRKTTNIDLYNLFMKNVHISIPKTKTDLTLEKSFSRVNEKYFFGLLDRPNLIWGSFSIRKLGHYEYGSDTISISKVFKNSDNDILDYVMYHEMLHKEQKFYTKNGRSYHHTSEFRKKEKEFDNQEDMEIRLKSLIRSKRRSQFIKSFKYGAGFLKRRKNWWFL